MATPRRKQLQGGAAELSYKSPVMKSFLAGTFSATCSTTLFQPFELVKTRLQMDSINQSQSSNPLPASESLLFGAAARSVAAVATIPFGVVKTRYESGFFSYRGVVDALSHIYRNEGIKGLSRGLLATLMRDVPFSSLYLMFYNQLKMFVIKEERIRTENNPGVFFMCGTVAGCLASLVTHPPDVVKTHLQLYPDRFSRSWHTFRYILQSDGLRGFFRGLVPRLIRRTLMAAMSWTVYEEAMIFLQVKS